MHYSSAVLGEEQVFDVELDRHTELLPVRDDLTVPSWDDERVAGAVEDHVEAVPESQEEEEEPEPGGCNVAGTFIQADIQYDL